jgi:hypothetical protein
MDIPDFLLVHSVSYERSTGVDGLGVTRYGTAASLACFVEEKHQLVLDATGESVLSQATVRARLDTTLGVADGIGDRVTLPSGRVATVIATARADGGALPVPSHLQLFTT